MKHTFSIDDKKEFLLVESHQKFLLVLYDNNYNFIFLTYALHRVTFGIKEKPKVSEKQQVVIHSFITSSLYTCNYLHLITRVIVRSNPRRLLPIWREKLRSHYHVTMTFDNDFCVWRWHYHERHSCVSVNAQTIARNAPRIRALITSRNDRHVWTDRNSFTEMSTEMKKNAVFFMFLSKKYT